MTNPGDLRRGAVPATILQINGAEPETVEAEVVEEILACISVNGVEFATFMCSPVDLDLLALGFLYNEGIFETMAEVASVHISDRDCVDVWLHKPVERPPRTIVTAGCGGGVTFDDLSKEHEPLFSALTVSPEQLAGLMKNLQTGAELYLRSRGIHTAVLAEGNRPLLQVEDIGRHNCIDKIAGAALRAGIETADKILLSSGRISSEMLNKARRLRVPVIASRTSPTSLSVALADAWNITIVAYLRGSRMRVYTHPERVRLAPAIQAQNGDG